MKPKFKSIETKYMKERRDFFRGLKNLDRRSFLKVSAATMGAAMASGLTPYHSFNPVSIAQADPVKKNASFTFAYISDSHLYEKKINDWFVLEGSRIFHNADLLGSKVAVSCDMCHPHASNTHAETYPKFQVQLGRVALQRDMIHWCIDNPVRGAELEPDNSRMRALEVYIMAQRSGTPMNYGKH